MRVLIADDDGLARRRLYALLSERTGVNIVSECVDGRQAVNAIVRVRPDVAFLEVGLPILDAFSLCAQLGDVRPHIVFVTRTAEYAVRAFELPALDYITKPYDSQRLLAAVSRAQHALAAQLPGMSTHELRSLLHEIRGQKSEHLAVNAPSGIVLLPTADIDWIEAEQGDVLIHAGRRTHAVRTTMTDMTQRLPSESFLRVHREAIVNLVRIHGIRPCGRNDVRLVLVDGTIVPLSRAYRKELQARLGLPRLTTVP